MSSKETQAVCVIDAPPTAIEAPSWQTALARWKATLAGRSTATAATYSSAVIAFFATPGAPDLPEITIEHLDTYAAALMHRAGKDAPDRERLTPATVNIRLAALKAFLLWCLNRDLLPGALSKERIKDALKGITAQVQRPYQIVEQDELGAMLQAAEADEADPARCLALIGFALGAGLRVSELCALNVGSIALDRSGPYVDVQQGKGRKDRQVPISEDVYALIAEYLTLTGRSLHKAADRDRPLFLTRKRQNSAGRLCTRHARRIIEETAKRAGLADRKHITPHGLRHSYAIRVLKGDSAAGQAGAPLPAVSKLLGHASIAVTGKYLAHFERQDLACYAPVLRRG